MGHLSLTFCISSRCAPWHARHTSRRELEVTVPLAPVACLEAYLPALPKAVLGHEPFEHGPLLSCLGLAGASAAVLLHRNHTPSTSTRNTDRLHRLEVQQNQHPAPPGAESQAAPRQAQGFHTPCALATALFSRVTVPLQPDTRAAE
ncbi:hypothetical protein K505DRAFT_334689 [Melanomma pulvis-pyrius CBS 109.77]|uniref:Uncharacterized protein n=1 Tax=Melanomma pulvis-pyrius CBS 109.77 TaxID=1314802 RepID=A0A6A6XLJ9_9PLEO|nr:hypothetical protein K505DRAFT_334689 [Melanomma pulvis-pyrius CBS 109.77]